MRLQCEKLERRVMLALASADVVIAYDPGEGAGNQWGDPVNALGAPDAGEGLRPDGTGTYVSLGKGGRIVLGFDATPAVDGINYDFAIWEAGAAESAEVFVSSDFGETFVSIGVAHGHTRFDLRSVGLSTMNALMIVDALPSDPMSGHVGDGHQGFDVDAVVVYHVSFDVQAGDANRNGVFDQADIGIVALPNKYGTGQPATWEQGDWTGDGEFNHLDIVAALQTGNYLHGRYAAVDAALQA